MSLPACVHVGQISTMVDKPTKLSCTVTSSMLYHSLTIFEKSAPPTPTMTIESGSLEAPTMRSTVRLMSDITPSCREARETHIYMYMYIHCTHVKKTHTYWGCLHKHIHVHVWVTTIQEHPGQSQYPRLRSVSRTLLPEMSRNPTQLS